LPPLTGAQRQSLIGGLRSTKPIRIRRSRGKTPKLFWKHATGNEP
jgi:hypothetical protein